MRINGFDNAAFSSIEEVQGHFFKPSEKDSLKNTGATDGKSFSEVLSEKASAAGNLHFSKHAAQRLFDRNIALSSSQLMRLTEGTDRAGSKGINDTLVMVDNLAFIVNTPTSTVVTAMDASESTNNVFSNIDGAVIA
ncbi:MAG: flagellar protein [Lachnospiraceae bacterium]|nr:flagellar protein [Lachnospiraceae bacterium]